MWMTSASASLLSLWQAAFVSLCRLRGCLNLGISIIALICVFGLSCVVMAPMLASCRVLAAPRWYVASCAFIGIVSQGLARPCSVDLSVSPQTEAEPVVGLPMDAQKWVFPAAFREETQYLVTPSYAEHLVFTGLDEIKQLYFRSLSDWILVRTFF